MFLVLEGQSLLVNCLPGTNWHLWFADLAAMVIGVWHSVVSFILASRWILQSALRWLIDTDLLSCLLGTVASLVTIWTPWFCDILWCAAESTINTFTVFAFVLYNVIVLPHLAIDDAGAGAGITLLGLCQILAVTVALSHSPCSCSDTFTASGRA